MRDQLDDSRTLQCMEIVGGNRAVRQSIAAHGLDIWIDSRPLGMASGGDVHYVSTCGGGQVTRLVLADVAGHGESVDAMATCLRKLMRKYINTLDQVRFAKALNQEFAAAAESGRFATALLLTYFSPTRHLIVCNAGHGRPLRYRVENGRWEFLDLECVGACPSLAASTAWYHFERVANLPLGVLDPTEYEQFAIRLENGDMMLLYTDAVTECADAKGELLGEEGLRNLVETLASDGLADLGDNLSRALDQRRGEKGAADDQTVIVFRRSEGPLPRPTVGGTVRMLAKMIGLRPV